MVNLALDPISASTSSGSLSNSSPLLDSSPPVHLDFSLLNILPIDPSSTDSPDDVFFCPHQEQYTTNDSSDQQLSKHKYKTVMKDENGQDYCY